MFGWVALPLIREFVILSVHEGTGGEKSFRALDEENGLDAGMKS